MRSGPGISVPGVVKQDSADVLTHQREAQFDAVEKHCAATNRKTGNRITGPSLVNGKPTV